VSPDLQEAVEPQSTCGLHRDATARGPALAGLLSILSIMECILAPETVEGSSSQPPAPNPAGAAGPPAPAAASAPLEQQADLLSLLSVEGARRTAGSLCGIVSQFAGVEGLVGLHGGLPPTSSFPLTSLQFGLADGRTVQLSGTQLAAAQQYNLVLAGYPPLLAWAKAHVQQLHAPPGPLALLITDGASHGLEVRSDGLPGAWGWGLLLASRTCTLTACLLLLSWKGFFLQVAVRFCCQGDPPLPPWPLLTYPLVATLSPFCCRWCARCSWILGIGWWQRSIRTRSCSSASWRHAAATCCRCR
jgi:hypothetical protein